MAEKGHSLSSLTPEDSSHCYVQFNNYRQETARGRPTDTQIGQTDTDRQTEIQRQTDRQTKKDRQAERKEERKKDRKKKGKQKERKKERQKDREKRKSL